MGEEKGFTLLELLVVLAIAGLMISIAAPFAVRTIENAALRADARQVASELRAVRQRAIDRQETIAVSSLSALAASRGGNASMPRGRFASAGGPATFYPDGTSSGAAFRLIEGDRAIDIKVAWLTGAVTIGEPP